MTQPRCELCRFWDGEWGWERKEPESAIWAGEFVRSKERRTCRRLPSHDIRHKDDWCGEFARKDSDEFITIKYQDDEPVDPSRFIKPPEFSPEYHEWLSKIEQRRPKDDA